VDFLWNFISINHIEAYKLFHCQLARFAKQVDTDMLLDWRHRREQL